MPVVHPAAKPDNSASQLNVDSQGNLLVNVAEGSFAVSSGAQYNATPPTLSSGQTGPLQCDQNGKMLISGTISASSAATYNSTTQNFTSGTANPLQADAHGALLVSQRDASGAVQASLANPLRVDPTGTTTQPVSGTVSVSNLPATQAISASSLPLPAGAATSAKQPALGTAGSPSADVLTVQGVASMTPLKVDGSAVTQPVSGSVSISGTPSVNATDNLTQVGGASITLGSKTSANSLPVVIASDQAAVNASLVPATSGGLSSTKLVSAASTNATSVKTSAGQLYNIQAFNTNTAARFLKVYDKASAPTVGTDTPKATYLLPGASAGAGCVIEISNGLPLTSGLAFAITGGIADSDTTAIGANDCVVNLQYK